MRAANFLSMFVALGAVPSVPALAQSSATPQTNAVAVALVDYRLNPGDKIDVSVWKETEMQKSLVIAPDGKIGFPLAGEVIAAGHTIAEVRNELVNRLKKYIPEPVVTVSLTANDGNRIFVIGQVNKPGMFGMNPQLNVLQALSLAGGGTPFAHLDNIIILRQTPGGQRVANFRFSQVSRGEHLEQNVTLESGDVVVVP